MRSPSRNLRYRLTSRKVPPPGLNWIAVSPDIPKRSLTSISEKGRRNCRFPKKSHGLIIAKRRFTQRPALLPTSFRCSRIRFAMLSLKLARRSLPIFHVYLFCLTFPKPPLSKFSLLVLMGKAMEVGLSPKRSRGKRRGDFSKSRKLALTRLTCPSKNEGEIPHHRIRVQHHPRSQAPQS